MPLGGLDWTWPQRARARSVEAHAAWFHRFTVHIIVAPCRCIVSKAAAEVDVASVNQERTVKACEDLCRFAYNESHRKRLMQADTILAVKARFLPPAPSPPLAVSPTLPSLRAPPGIARPLPRAALAS